MNGQKTHLLKGDLHRRQISLNKIDELTMLEKTAKNREYRFVLIALILVFGALISYELRIYMSGFLGACTLYVLLRVQMVWLTEKLKLKKGLSATLIVLESFFFFLIPITGMVFLGIDVAQNINIDFEGIKDSILIFVEDIETRFNISIFNVENIASSIPKWSGNLVGTIAESTYSMVINSFIIVFVLYFMLVNYKDFEITIREILPFSSINKQKFLSESKSIVQANAVGIPLVGILQGGIAYCGYVLFGLENAALWAIVTIVLSILPIVGSGLIWVPAGAFFILQGDYVNGLGLLFYGLVIMGGSDYIIRLLISKKLANIHPLITVLGVLIGIPMFGFWGVIFGPLIISLFMLFFNMYRRDYIPGSLAQINVTTEYKEKRIRFSRKLRMKKGKNDDK